MLVGQPSRTGEFKSQSGNQIFGIQGWSWGTPTPTSITFFLDGTAFVSDQHGRPIKGALVDGKEVLFAQTPPEIDTNGDYVVRSELASHAQVIAALKAEEVDWQTLTHAGMPQLLYEELVKLDKLPPTPPEALARIVDPELRKDALRARCEADEAKAKERASKSA